MAKFEILKGSVMYSGRLLFIICFCLVCCYASTHAAEIQHNASATLVPQIKWVTLKDGETSFTRRVGEHPPPPIKRDEFEKQLRQLGEIKVSSKPDQAEVDPLIPASVIAPDHLNDELSRLFAEIDPALALQKLEQLPDEHKQGYFGDMHDDNQSSPTYEHFLGRDWRKRPITEQEQLIRQRADRVMELIRTQWYINWACFGEVTIGLLRYFEEYPAAPPGGLHFMEAISQHEYPAVVADQEKEGKRCIVINPFLCAHIFFPGTETGNVSALGVLGQYLLLTADNQLLFYDLNQRNCHWQQITPEGGTHWLLDGPNLYLMVYRLEKVDHSKVDHIRVYYSIKKGTLTFEAEGSGNRK